MKDMATWNNEDYINILNFIITQLKQQQKSGPNNEYLDDLIKAYSAELELLTHEGPIFATDYLKQHEEIQKIKEKYSRTSLDTVTVSVQKAA